MGAMVTVIETVHENYFKWPLRQAAVPIITVTGIIINTPDTLVQQHESSLLM